MTLQEAAEKKYPDSENPMTDLIRDYQREAFIAGGNRVLGDLGMVVRKNKLLRDAYEWWEYYTSKKENDRLIAKYYPEKNGQYPRFFMDTDKAIIYCWEHGIEVPSWLLDKTIEEKRVEQYDMIAEIAVTIARCNDILEVRKHLEEKFFFVRR